MINKYVYMYRNICTIIYTQCRSAISGCKMQTVVGSWTASQWLHDSLENSVEPVSSWNGILQLLLSCLRNCYIWLSNIYCAPFASEMYVQHCGCYNDSECSRRSVGRCSKQVVTGIFQWTMALITGKSEETHIVWTTRELRVWTQCWQMIS